MLLPISAMILLSATEPMNRDPNNRIARHAILTLKRFILYSTAQRPCRSFLIATDNYKSVRWPAVASFSVQRLYISASHPVCSRDTLVGLAKSIKTVSDIRVPENL